MKISTCWTLTEGHAGMESQCRGLAEALGVTPERKRARPRAPWIWLPTGCWPRPLAAPAPGSDALAPPWPDVLISCGRRSVDIALAIRRASGGRTFAVHIQDPHVRPSRFDLVVAPRHDGLTGPNVVVTAGAVHPVTPEKLAAAAGRFGPALAHLPRPLVAVLVGGSNRSYRLTPAVTAALAERLVELCRAEGAGLAVTPSRRTGRENERELRRRLAGVPSVVWDGSGENPYLGYLALADAIVVTCDSVSMVSEAIATGKPVYVVDIEGGSRRLRRFHEMLRADGITRPFDGRLDRWDYAPPDDTARAAEAIRRGLAAREGGADRRAAGGICDVAAPPK